MEETTTSMNLPDATDSDRADAPFYGPLLDLALEPDDQGRQPAIVRFLARMEGIGGSILFALGGLLAGAAAAIPVGGWTLDYVYVVATIYGLASLLVIGRHGLLAGKPWARKLAAGLAVCWISYGIALVLWPIMSPVARRLGGKKFLAAAVGIGLIAAIGGVAVLWHLYRPHVNRYFDPAYQPSDRRACWNMAVWRFWMSMLDEFRAMIDELPDYSVPNWGMLDEFRAAHDALTRLL